MDFEFRICDKSLHARVIIFDGKSNPFINCTHVAILEVSLAHFLIHCTLQQYLSNLVFRLPGKANVALVY